MSAGPRWISAGEYVEREGDTKVASVVVPNDQIIASPTTPVVIVPATEILNYDTFPSSLPVVVKAFAILDATAGTYTNVNSGSIIVLAYGSDWSLSIGKSAKVQNDATLFLNPFRGTVSKRYFSFLIAEETIDDGGLQDNAISFVIDNQGDGDFTGGHADNTLTIEVHYLIKSV